jgi:DNA-binding IclR family transcriptional regulator
MERAGTVDKALSVLEALRGAEAPESLAALSSVLQMPKATLHRLLASLAQHELVEQRADGRYALGVGLMRLGLAAQGLDPFVRAARVELEREVQAFNETFFLVGARAGRLFVLDKVEGSGLLRAAPNIGSEVPVETTASGRLYLGLSPATLGSDAGARVPRIAVERAVTQGYDLNQGEWIAGLTVVAAPVVALGRMFGTVACGGAASQLSGARLEEAVHRTRDVTARIVRVLSGQRSEAHSSRGQAKERARVHARAPEEPARVGAHRRGDPRAPARKPGERAP